MNRAQRFWNMVSPGSRPDVDPSMTPCLIHSGADNGRGYAKFVYDGKNGYAHRFAWQLEHGPIPEGMTVDHLCEVRRCVNIEHLELAEPVANYLRTALAKRECPNGHPYTPETMGKRRGHRFCRICKRAADARTRARRRGVAA